MNSLKIKITFILLFVAAISFAQKDEKQLSLDFTAYLKNAQYHEAYGMFDTIMAKKLGEDAFKTAMDGVFKQLGPIGDYKFVDEERGKEMNKTYTQCEFKTSTLDIELVFNSSLRIIGFHFVDPLKLQGSKYTPAPYDSGKYVTHKIFIKTGQYKMPGILTVPKDVVNPPVVIFVHGSGPNDMDESLGPNKTFRDLAAGLAVKGIATIRYDKRTKVYGGQFAEDLHNATLKEEAIEDVVSAVNAVKKFSTDTNYSKGLDTNRIYVLGHSLGAMLAPRIAHESKKIKGIIMMAGDSRLLEDVMIYQNTYLASLDTIASHKKDNDQKVAEMDKQLKLAESPDLKPNTPDSLLPYGVAAPYWIDINHYNQIKSAQELTMPVLVIQGERDYQVTMVDYNLWKEKLGNKKNVTFKLYPKLNHLFMEGEGKSTPAEYSVQGHVPMYVIDDIANWINKK
jgi:dienelactone hydrolase